MKVKRIFLIRHAQSRPVDEEGRIRNFPGLPLTEEGVSQARLLGKVLKDSGIMHIYTSDAIRAYQTAEIIREELSGNLPITKFQWLREFSLGELEGKFFWDYIDIIKNIIEPGNLDPENKFPGGESINDLRKRVIPPLKELLKECEERICLVAHGGVNRVILSEFMGFSPSLFLRLDQENACVNIIDAGDNGAVIRLLNFSPSDIVKVKIPVSTKNTL